MLNCPQCDRQLSGNERTCLCGWRVPKKSTPEMSPYRVRDVVSNNAVNRAVAERLREIRAHCDSYRKQHPNASNRLACMDWLKQKGKWNLVPTKIREEAEMAAKEAAEERRAIQEA